MSILDSLGRPRTLAVLLALSLGANLFLIGGIAGRMSGHRHGHPMPPPIFGLGGPGMESGLRHMPSAGREHLRGMLRERRPELRAEHEALRKLHRRIAKELGRESPDRAAIERSFEEIRSRTLEIEKSVQAAFLDSALAMEPAARQQMLDAMLEHRKGQRWKGPGRGMPPGPPPAPPSEAPAAPPEAPVAD